MRRILIGLTAVIAAFAAVCIARTAQLASYHADSAAPLDSAIAGAFIGTDRFSGAIRFPTISHQDSAAFEPVSFVALHEYLRAAFPGVHARLTREVVAGYSLLFTWAGTDTTLDPFLLMGHLDVVPVEAGTESRWTHPPFDGRVADGYVWGRGTLDDKSTVVAILEAVELLVAQDFTPRRTLYLAFGHDEEVGGQGGARVIAELLKARSGRLAFLLDEGGVVAEGIVPGVARPVAMIGVVEKGSIGVELTVEATGGHSSMPPPHTAVGILAKAITRLEAQQMPLRMTPVVEEMFVRLAPEMPLAARVPLANLWAFRPLLLRLLGRQERVAPMLRTTSAATMISGSPKENALPIIARAVVNFRILPGDTPDDVLDHVRRVVADTQVKVTGSGRSASLTADYAAPAFEIVEKTVAQVFPGAIPVPFLMIGGTDARHYEGLTRNTYRFNPIVATPELVSGAHGTNERVRADDFIRAARFFAQLIRNAQ
ncbi:MAG TPA: M20 family peptidase [Gemmatimonadaceae bacterium]